MAGILFFAKTPQESILHFCRIMLSKAAAKINQKKWENLPEEAFLFPAAGKDRGGVGVEVEGFICRFVFFVVGQKKVPGRQKSRPGFVSYRPLWTGGLLIRD
jgi:hypothetical protein